MRAPFGGKEICSAERPNWNKLLAYPKPKLTTEEKAFLAGPVEELCACSTSGHYARAA